MSQTCLCGRPVSDAYVCSACWRERDEALSEIPELLVDLWDAIGRQTKLGARVGGPGAERPLPINRNLGTLNGSLRHELVTWVLVLLEDLGEPIHGPLCRRCLHPSCQRIRDSKPPEDTIPDMARWLLVHSERGRHHVDAPLMVDGITALVAFTRRSLDRPGISRYLPCPSTEPCHGRIRVTADTIHARCDTCEWETTDLLWLGRLLRGDEPVMVTAVEACHLLIADGIELVPATLRKWVERGKISTRNPHGPTCVYCDHDCCYEIRGRIHNWYDIDEIRRVAAPRVEIIKPAKPPRKEPGYHGVHARLRRSRGTADQYACHYCGDTAASWAYDHGDSDERVDSKGLRYSLDVERYQPLCDPCHVYLDSRYVTIRRDGGNSASVSSVES